MRSKKQIIKIMISTLLLLSCMILFVGCGNSKPQSAANNSTDTSQNDNADSNANGSDNEPAQNTSKFTLKQVEFNASGFFRFTVDSDYGLFSYNNKCGIIDIDGNIVIEPIYEDMSYPSENLVIAEKSDGSFVILDITSGKEVGSIEGNENISANEIYEISNPSVLFGDDADKYIGFSEGCIFMNITSYAKDLFEENYNTEYNSVCIDKTGKERFATKYNITSNYNSGIAIGYYSDNFMQPKTLAGLDKDGKELWTVENVNEYESQSDGVIIYQDRDSSLYGAVDLKGNNVLECEYEKLTRAGNGLIGFKKYGLWGYLDYKGNEVIKPQFSNAQKFSGGIALVEKDSKQYLINTKGETVIDNVGEGASYYGNGLVILNYVSVYDFEGNPVSLNSQSVDSNERVSNALNYNGGKILKEGAENNQKFYQVIKSE
nr:WG repeat-containing protein [Ruminococcus bromii]